MGMDRSEAIQIGAEKLNVPRELFDKCWEVALEMGVRPQDRPPMTLVLAILGVSKAHENVGQMESEMADAIELLTAAEKEWRLEQQIGRGHA